MARRKAVAEDMTRDDVEKLINDRFGTGTLRRASDPSLVIERIPTGILSLDYLLRGGFPRNRYVELYGNASVGKTYVALKHIATAQSFGHSCAFVDVERTFDPEWAASIGVDLDELGYEEQEVHGNQLVDVMETMVRSGAYDVIVMDSVAALLPKQEYEASAQDGTFGTQQAKLMSYALRKITAGNRKTVVVFINQVRDNIGGSVFAKRTITSGGRALGHYSGVRIEMVKTENIKKKAKAIDPSKGNLREADTVTGHRILARIEKNKTGGAKPYEQTTFVFDYEQAGIDSIEDLIYLGRVTNLVHKRGDHWWVDGYQEERQHGRTRFKKWLKKNRAIADELREWILNGEEPEDGD